MMQEEFPAASEFEQFYDELLLPATSVIRSSGNKLENAAIKASDPHLCDLIAIRSQIVKPSRGEVYHRIMMPPCSKPAVLTLQGWARCFFCV
jgi:hypothetical protein